MTTKKTLRYRLDCVSYQSDRKGSFFVVDWYSSVIDAINDISGFGWHEIEDSKKDSYLIVDAYTHEISAVGRFIVHNNNGLDVPALLWVLEDGKTITKTRETVTGGQL